MPKRALLEKRPWLLASLAAAIAYYVLRQGTTPETYLLALKGSALGFLAIYAYRRHLAPESLILSAILFIAAAGSVVFELYFSTGAFILVIGFGLGIWLFGRHLRESPSLSQRAAAAALLLLTPAIAWLLSDRMVMQGTAVIYALVLGGMAASAWMSRFSRYRVGAGAVLVVVAVLLDLAGIDLLASRSVAGRLAWPLYYLGHFGICTGVFDALRRR